ncbi:S9 family peptidase [Yinghuangia soli]|uniref:Prolyl oligopeptidase family serine peptidase n=1 Tax=Yinghuangia soli TaxID=2908204 RepID=A0AA41PUP7_9ACTN|nr:prolyl oligopeptidase family serine peptidase [Yinghuangia soli]MCF2526208.1 prolyl oligopeptidase family serine peptidase [Yinghuangia soli]
MTVQRELPYGSWPSPITAEALVAGAASPGEVRVDGADVWWSESRPSEGGREQLVRRAAGGERVDVLPEGVSARTRVHEYGGGAWAVRGGVLVYANWADQRLYRLDPGSAEPVPVTPEPSVPHGWRFADAEIVPAGVWGPGAWAVAVRESHEPTAVEAHGEAVNEIVAIPLDGSAVAAPGAVRVLVTGPDFVSSPRVAPGGGALAWTQWNHPDMPWDATELVVARVDAGADGPELTGAEVVAGGPGESVVQPTWAPDDSLWFASDRRDGWWNLHRVGAGGQVEVVAPVDAEIGGPQWRFGASWFAFLADGRVACALERDGLYDLAIADPVRPEQPPQAVVTGLTWVDQVAAGPAGGADIVLVGAAPAEEAEPLGVSLQHAHVVAAGDEGDPDDTEFDIMGTAEAPEVGHALLERLRPARESVVGREWFSIPEPISFPSADGRVAYGILYRPRNPEAAAPAGTLPPLLVSIHGGPTAMTRAMLTLNIQYWTTRGFAVVDVNYGGSTGYGRPYRELLNGAWGVVDVQDCIAAARHLAGTGVADPGKLAIRGGSAGGFTTLAALAAGDTFAAGANHFGVADLAALARDTHKFESRYLDRLVGPYPEAADRYKELSPINHTDDLSCPLAVFQGLEDEVVPPAQSQMIVDAVRAKGLPYVYLTFEGEQHGFRKAENIIRCREAELWFFGKVFGFEPADAIEPPPGEGF